MLLLLLLLGALVFLNTRPGAGWLQRQAVERVGESIQGRVEAEAAEVQGTQVVLRGLRLHDPEGELVAEIEEVRLELAVAAAAAGQLRVRSATLRAPRLYLKSDERGFNLTRAIAARRARAREQGEPDRPSRYSFRLLRLTVVDGLLEYVREGEEEDLRLRLEGLGGAGEAGWDGPARTLSSRLELRGEAAAPLEGKVSLEARFGMERGAMGGGLRLRAPGLELELEVDRSSAGAARLEVKALRVEPEAGRAALPSYPLKVPAALRGSASLDGPSLHAELSGGAGKAAVEAQGSLDLERRWSDGFTLAARGVDLSELVENGPRSSLQLTLKAKGGGRSLETLSGEATLSIPASQLSGETLGPVELSATARGGAFQLPAFHAVLPGVELRASGQGTWRRVALEGELKATDLGALARALGRMGRGPPLQLEGQGALRFQAVGPPRHPGLSARGAFPWLRYRATSARGLRFTADLEDVTRPLTAEASLQATALGHGERQLRRLVAAVATAGRELRAEVRFTPVLRGAETGELALRLAGEVDGDSRGLLLRELGLRYPEAEWSLQRPARVAFRDGVAAEPIALRSGTQSLTVGGTMARGAFSASADLQLVDLKLLPSALMEPSWNLAGVLSAQVRAQGTARRPEVEARVELNGGRFREYGSLGLSLDGRYLEDRAQGTLRATSPVARVSARFDAPVRGLLRRRREPVALQLEVEEQSLEDALAAAGRPERVAGRVRARLSVTGTADDPAARLTVSARQLQPLEHPRLPLRGASLDLTVESGAEGTLTARLDAEAVGTTARAVVRTPFRLGELISRPPDRARWLAAPLEADLDARELPLELLEALGVEGVRGQLSVRAEARGTLRQPALAARLEGHRVRVGDAPPSELAVDLVSTAAGTGATLTARRGEAELAAITASLDAPLGALADPARLERAALALDGTVHPISLAEWIPIQVDPQDRRSRAPSGRMTARLRGRGTLADPRLELVFRVEQLQVGDECVGDVDLRLGYARAQAALTLAVAAPHQGRLSAEGTARMDLSLPALRRGADFREAPFELAARADRMELGVLTHLVPRVRAISGKVYADVRLQGKASGFTRQGWVEWRSGALALDGYGDYREVQLRAEATRDRFHLQRLEAESGAGKLQVSALAIRQGGRYELDGRVETEDLPVVVDDQLLAVVTTRMTVEGDLAPRLVDIRDLTIPEALIVLPEVKQKDLQEIDRPDDILLVRHGKPLRRKRTRPTPEEGQEPPRRYQFLIHAPKNLWVRSTDANVELGLSEGFRVEYGDRTRLDGAVKIIRGRVETLGREFVLQRDSLVTFSGPARQPFVNATAVHRNEREEVTVFLNVRGEGKGITIQTTSQPPLTESEIYTLLVTGRRTLKRGAGTASIATGDAASLLGALAANQLKKTLAAKLPLDVLSIEAPGSAGLGGTRVEAGRYLSDKAYLGWEVRFGADPRKGQNNVGFRFEYELTPRLSLQTEYGDARSGGADLIWSREY